MENLVDIHTDTHYWVTKLKRFMSTENAMLWLSSPNEAFNNQVPFDMIKEGKSEELRQLVVKFKEKAFALS